MATKSGHMANMRLVQQIAKQAVGQVNRRAGDAYERLPVGNTCRRPRKPVDERPYRMTVFQPVEARCRIAQRTRYVDTIAR